MELLKEFLIKELHIEDAQVFEKFELYNNLILEWNEKINLISRKLDSVESTILNSIFFLTKYDISKCKDILDLGTGGGIPGIPLAIINPDINFLLLDSIKKKMLAVEDIITKLKLSNIRIITGRAEELSKEKLFKNKFDIVISKSVSTLHNLYNWGRGFLNKDGKIVCIKGGDVQKENIELDKKIKTEIINFDFEEKYKIEDKKIVILKI